LPPLSTTAIAPPGALFALANFTASATTFFAASSEIVFVEMICAFEIVAVATKKRRRIFFSGPGSLVEKGFWMNDSTVVLAGKSHDQNAEIPMLWMITMNDTSNHVTRYEYALH